MLRLGNKNIVSRAISSDEVVDIFESIRMKKPNISIFLIISFGKLNPCNIKMLRCIY